MKFVEDIASTHALASLISSQDLDVLRAALMNFIDRSGISMKAKWLNYT